MGEYEPNDSRNVTGANNQSSGGKAANGGTDDRNVNQTGQHWQSTDAPISQSHQQGHGQDAGMRSQAPSQMGGSNDTGQPAQFQSDPHLASELNQQGIPGLGQEVGGQESLGRAEAHARAGGDDGTMSSAMGGGIAGQIREHMDIIGADGVHVGTVDHVEGDRIKLTRRDSSAGYEGEQHSGHHHYLSIGLVAGIEGDTVRLSANGDVAYAMEEEEGEGGSGAT